MKLISIPSTVRQIRCFDPDTAINETMLEELTRTNMITSFTQNVQRKIDFDRLAIDLNNLLGLPGSSMPRVRSISNAHRELTKRAMGISADCIRKNVQSGVIPSLKIGNRAYIALDFFVTEENVYAMYDRESRFDESKIVLQDAAKQIDRLKSDHCVMPSVQRKRKK